MKAVLAVAAVLGACAPARLGPTSGVQIYEAGGSTTEGDTTLAVEPDAAFRAACDFSRWKEMFPDIADVVVKQPGEDALITLVHRDGNVDNLHVRAGNRVVWFEDTGGRARVWVELAFEPGRAPHTTHVHSRLHAEVKGVASWFVSEGKVRVLRENTLEKDLASIHAYFSRPHVTAAAATSSRGHAEMVHP